MAGGLLTDKNGVPLPDDQQPSLGGWLKSVVKPGEKPQATIPLSEVPGVVAGAPGAILSSATGAKSTVTSDGFDEYKDPGSPSDVSVADNDAKIIADENDWRSFPGGNTQAQAWFRKQGYSYAPVGGEDDFKKAFVDDPKVSDAANRDLANTKAQHSSTVAEFYKGQTERDTQAAAEIKQRVAEDQQNLAARQQKLDQATEFYTNDLADQGKFWTNPGNIVSAIAFSLMPIFSNDPTVGAKLINQAIDRDMANRQHAAQGTLGALQSNLSGYHKIAGDRQAGDLLARAEAHRIAAQEIARIGAQFEGPLAQKQMAANIADQQQRRDVAKMEFYKQNVHVDAKQMDPRLHAASYQGPGGYKPGIPLGGAGPAESAPGTAITGHIQGTPTTSMSGEKGSLPPAVRAMVNAGGARGVMKADNAGMIKDPKTLREATKAAVMQEAIDLYGAGNPRQAWAKMMERNDKALAPFAVETSKNAVSRQAVNKLRAEMGIIERLEQNQGRDPSEFVSYWRKVAPAGLKNAYDGLLAKDPAGAANKHEEKALLRAQAVRAFEAHFQNVLNQNMHDLNGGAVSEGEAARTEAEVSQAKSWPLQKKFVERKSSGLEAFVRANKVGLTPGQLMDYRIRSGGGTLNESGPVKGQPGPAPAAPLTGGMSAPQSVMPTAEPNMSQGPLGAQR